MQLTLRRCVSGGVARLRRRRHHMLSVHRERIAAAHCSPCLPSLSPRGHSAPYRHPFSPLPTTEAAAAAAATTAAVATTATAAVATTTTPTVVLTQTRVVRSLSLRCTAVVPDRRCFTGRGFWPASDSSRCLSCWSWSSSSSSSLEGKSNAENAQEEEVEGAPSTALAEGNGKRVVVGMSGGVDSSVVAMLLQQQASGIGREYERWECVLSSLIPGTSIINSMYSGERIIRTGQQ